MGRWFIYLDRLVVVKSALVRIKRAQLEDFVLVVTKDDISRLFLCLPLPSTVAILFPFALVLSKSARALVWWSVEWWWTFCVLPFGKLHFSSSSTMKLIKPEWIEHGPKESLSSLHINPTGVRLALAGKYNAVDCIRLFRLASILDETHQPSSRLLCRIDTQCPLCVRFSYTSDILAVASRQNVLLYHLTATNPNVVNRKLTEKVFLHSSVD